MTGKQFAVNAGGVLYGFILATAMPDDLSREAKMGLLLSFALYWIAIGLHEARQRRWRCGMSLLAIMASGAILGAIAGGLIYAFYQPPPKSETDDGTSLLISKSDPTVRLLMSPLIPDPNLRPADPTDLDLYFFALMGAAGKDNVQFADVTITNRTPQKMHLEIWGLVNYWKDNGEPSRFGLKAKWNAKDLKGLDGEDFLDLDRWETKKGRLVIPLGNPDKRDISRWFVDANEHVFFEIFDAVTGKRIAFKAMGGYPRNQELSPLPSVAKSLALNFPPAPPTRQQNAPAPDALDLLFRTRDPGLNKTRLSLHAMLKNNSAARMELSVNLLGRSAQHELIWVTIEGVWKRDDMPAEKVLVIEHDGTVDATLRFDLAQGGMVDPTSQQLSTLPQDSLLEVSDRISGKTIWCAISSGYPPGTDMRGFTILPPQPIAAAPKPQPNSGNPLVSPTNDTK